MHYIYAKIQIKTLANQYDIFKNNNKEKLIPGMQKDSINVNSSKHYIKKKSQQRVIIFITHF